MMILVVVLYTVCSVIAYGMLQAWENELWFVNVKSGSSWLSALVTACFGPVGVVIGALAWAVFPPLHSEKYQWTLRRQTAYEAAVLIRQRYGL